ncbi:MAG TPA: hypothetical protein VFR14_01000 [Candidatus Limnocylindrales bacterium]|nr:hypothetical protein [Candidatus Limnocylindrales bacterium]
MIAAIGFAFAATLSIAVALAVAGPRHEVRRDPTFELADVAARLVGVLSALAGFAVTGIVFLVTQAGNVAAPTGTPFTTVLAMFVVAYMGYFVSSLLFANVSHRAEAAVFDLAAAQYAGASISLFFVFIGWLALRPLFETFGLRSIAELTGWFLIGAVVVGAGLLTTSLHRSGYTSVRTTVLLPVIAASATIAYAVVVAVAAPTLRSPEAALNLTVIAFGVGVPAYAVMTILPILARHERAAAVLARRWHLAVVAYAEGAMVLVGFLLLAVLGLA